MKISFLVNPISGGGEGKRIFKYLPEIMQALGVSSDDWVSEYTDPHNFEAQIDSVLHRGGKVIAVGGDGTMAIVLNRAVRCQTDVALGLIPLGTGNDLARAMAIHRNYSDKGLLNTIRKLLWVKSRLFDLWSLNEKYTLGAYLSIGLDARIARQFNIDRKEGKVFGSSVFMNKLHYFKVFLRLRKHRLAEGSFISWKDEKGKEFQKNLEGNRSLMIGNIPSFAGGANPFHKANYQDELLEVVPVRSFLKFIGCITTNLSKTYSSFFTKFIVPSHQAASVVLKVPEGEYVQVDGEDFTDVFAGKEVEICFAGKVKMLVLDEW